MRSRNIKPGFFRNENLAKTPWFVRMVFAGLWLYVDRDGRCEYRPEKIVTELFMYEYVNGTVTAQDVHSACLVLAWCFPHPFVILYEIDSISYLEVTNFKKHQNPHIKERSREFPPPTEDNILNPDNISKSPVLALYQHGFSTFSARLDSLIPRFLEEVAPSTSNCDIAEVDDMSQSDDTPYRTFPKKRKNETPEEFHQRYMTEWATPQAEAFLDDPLTKEAFPGINRRQEVNEALSWLRANPSKRKKAISAFLHRWLSKAQEKAGRPRSNYQPTQLSPGLNPKSPPPSPEPTPEEREKGRLHLRSWLDDAAKKKKMPE